MGKPGKYEAQWLWWGLWLADSYVVEKCYELMAKTGYRREIMNVQRKCIANVGSKRATTATPGEPKHLRKRGRDRKYKSPTTAAALAANLRPLQTHLSCPACIALGNFILEFPSINSRSRLFSRWRTRARSVEQTTSLARACVNVRIGKFMLGNSRTKLPAQCMLGRRGEFEGVAICNAERCQPCI